MSKGMETGGLPIADVLEKPKQEGAEAPGESGGVEVVREQVHSIGEPVPAGWVALGHLAKTLGVSYEFLRGRCETLRKEHPEWFKEYLNKQGHNYEYLHPDLIKVISDEIKMRGEPAPDGWLTISGLAEKLGVSPTLIIKRIEIYRDAHPEWFKDYIDKRGRITQHLHPEFIKVIEVEVATRKKAPEAWVTNNELSSLLHVAPQTVERNAEIFRETHPDWFKFYLDKGNHVVEHLHPDLAKLIREKIESRGEPAPQGWMTMGHLNRLLGVAYPVLTALMEPLEKLHPEWIGDYLGQGRVNRIVKHYHPDLIRLVREEVESREKVPEGWMTNGALAESLGVTFLTVKRVADSYRESRTEWFKKYFDTTGHQNEFLHPDLVKIISEQVAARELPPQGWLVSKALGHVLGISYRTVRSIADRHRELHPEWFKDYLDRAKHVTEHYHPDLVKLISLEVQSRGEQAPQGWRTNNEVVALYGMSFKTIKERAEAYRNINPEWFRDYLDKTKQVREHYHPDLVRLIGKEIENRGELAPEGWMTINAIAALFKVGERTIRRWVESYRTTNPDWFKSYHDKVNNVNDHCHPEMIKIIREKIDFRGESAPEGWVTAVALSSKLGCSPQFIRNQAEIYRNSHPEWFSFYLVSTKQLFEHYHPDLVSLLREQTERLNQPPPEGWVTKNNLAKLLKANFEAVRKRADFYRISHPEWFKPYLGSAYRISEHLHPNLVLKISEDLKGYIEGREAKVTQEKLRKAVESFTSEVAEGQTQEAQQFQSMIRAVGPSRCLDILYKFRPDFRGLPVEYVKGIIADYLGDSLVVRNGFRIADVEVAAQHLSDLSFQEGLYEAIKDNGLRFYFQQRRTVHEASSSDIVYAYLNHLIDNFAHLQNKDLDNVIQRAVVYYDSVFKDFHKPEQFIDALVSDREFPDINQRINMKELTEKKRLLIADEMGLGKSASVIMAKEQLGVRCTLVVAPSNVIATWQRYLSDNSEQGGYYQEGKAPRVLVVEKPEDLDETVADAYDFILVSHERMNERYATALQAVDYDMMVIDEVHKFKSVEGARAPQLLQLAEKIEGENKYLALLSGTPIPNKIEDLAITLKLLYPDKFSEISDRELVRQIIHGDIVDLRSLLLPHMQLKDLQEGVEMPALEDKDVDVEMSPLEKEVYEVLLEDDEITATEKIKVLRQFLLNPRLVDATPGIESAKVQHTSEALAQAFQECDRVVLYVNDYIEGVVRGEGSILEDLKLPAGVDVRVIHGDIAKAGREATQTKFNRGNGKMLLIVSGQTADVGVDYSGADRVFFYNEPWTEYQRRQELARAYRPGLKHPLKSESLIMAGTIEEGMHEYIHRKYDAVEKLLRGIPLTDLEKELLEKDEKNEELDLSVNPELAEYYFSSWDKMMKMFAYAREIGETDFKKFLVEYGRDYAESYVDLGNRSYQANANRVSGTLIHEMVQEVGTDPRQIAILDLASGPEMLKQHIGDAYQNQVTSVDLNKEHFAGREGGKMVEGSILDIPVPEKSFDFANLCLSLHYTSFAPSRGRLERLKALTEMNRVLKSGGRAVINLVYNLELKNFTRFQEAVEELGFRIVSEYTGEVEVRSQYRSQVVTLEKVKDLEVESVEETSEKLGKIKRDGLKFAKIDRHLKNSRRIVSDFEIGGKKIGINFNRADQAVLEEEQVLLVQGEALKAEHGEVRDIPAQEVIDNNFVRIKVGKKYILFKKLTRGSGVVIIR